MQKLQQEYTDKGVVWLTINSSAPGTWGNLSPEQAAAKDDGMENASDRVTSRFRRQSRTRVRGKELARRIRRRPAVPGVERPGRARNSGWARTATPVITHVAGVPVEETIERGTEGNERWRTVEGRKQER
jgi:hypothetical protein